MPDGSIKEFRPYGSGAAYADTYGIGYFSINSNGNRRTTTYYEDSSGTPHCSEVNTQITTSGMNYYSADGSGMRLFVPYNANDHWTMYQPDGTTIQNLPTDDTSLIQRVTDRNGNKMVWKPATINSHAGTQIINDVGQYVFLYDSSGTTVIEQSGFYGETLTTTISYKAVWVNRRYSPCLGPSSYYTSYGTLHENVGGIDTITLPSQAGGLRFQFTYHGSDTEQTGTSYTDGFGELKTMSMPSGASVEYSFDLDSSALVPISVEDHNWITSPDGAVLQNSLHQRALTYDTVYDGSTNSVTELTSYQAANRYGGDGVTSTTTTPDGSVTTSLDNGAATFANGFLGKTIHADGSITEKVWAQNIAPGVSGFGGLYHRTGTNAYVKAEYTTIANASGVPSLTAFKDYDYDKNGNVLEVREYDWAAYSAIPRTCGDPGCTPTGGVPTGATLKRRTTNTYYNPTPIATDSTTSDSDIYANPSSPKLHNVIKSTEIKDGSGTVKARTEFDYDDASNTGNLTTVRSWDSTKGAVSNPLTSGNSISTTTTYNTYGEPTVITDAKDIETHITYGDVTGPSGVVTGLYPTQTITAYGTSVARTMQAVYDFYTGVVTTATDVDNSISTVTEYDDLGRPTKVKSAYGTDFEAWTQSIYHDGSPTDHNRYVIVKSDVAGVGDAGKVGVQYYDQLGRVRLTRTLENASTEVPDDPCNGAYGYNCYGIKVQTRYKYTSGYIWQVSSNPYRASTSSGASSEPTMGWTRSKAWSTGHESQVETFSGATLPQPFLTSGYNTSSTGIVQTDTDSNATTVTDQAGKVRRSIVNGIGQMTRVDEPNSSGALGTVSSPNQNTDYTYDVLNNLLGVSQGSQTRTFAYSSLGRLTSAANPESGTIAYAYDNNGNLTSKVDARTITTSYTYDAQNRVTARNYDDSTPDVTYTYDNKTHAYGKLSKVATSVSTTEYTSFDVVGRVTAAKQTTGSTDYTTAYTYKLNGSLYEETYPSGRMVKNTFAGDGDLSQVETKPSGGSYSTRASNFVYNAAGGVQSLQLGNGKYETTAFNSRLQPTQIGLGNSTTDTSLLRLQYGYGTTANNGNVQSQTIAVPNAGTSAGFTADQTYTYDSLNRLGSATENVSSRVNYALASNGGSASASSVLSSDFPVAAINNGERKGANWESGGGWADATPHSFPDWVQVDFSATKSIDEIDVFTLQDSYTSPSEPTESMTFSNYGATSFDVQYWNGSAWVTVTGGSVTGNNKVWKKLTFSAVSTSKIRVTINNTPDSYFSRITGLEAWGSASASQTWKQEFSYDRYGNRSFMTGSGHTDTLGSCTTMCNPAFDSTTNRITSSGYAFDNSGNTTADPDGRSFVYDAENKQTSVSNGGGTLGTYYYDGDGKRVKKTSGPDNTIFVYDAAGKLIEEYAIAHPNPTATPPDPPTTSYVYAGSRLLSTETSGPTTTYLTADHLGSPRINTNGSGSVVARHDYMPFGEEIYTPQRTTGTGYTGDGVRKKFTGYERDGESGLDFAEARMYLNGIGRFTAVDPLASSASPSNPQTFNRYVYVMNNPSIHTDSSGMAPGDYYSYDGTYLTHDDKDDNKVYFATVSKIENGSVYAYTDSIKETTIDEIIKVQGNGTEDPNPVQVLSGTVSATVDAALTGGLKGAGNFLLDSTTPGALGLLPNIPYSGDAEASYGNAFETGLSIGTGVAAGAVAPSSAVSIIPKFNTVELPPTIGPGPFAAESIPARNTGPLNSAEQSTINRIGQTSGCHTCGSLNPGTKSGNFVGDHQLPSKLIQPGTPQRIYPQCLGCSRQQGGVVRTLIHGRY